MVNSSPGAILRSNGIMSVSYMAPTRTVIVCVPSCDFGALHVAGHFVDDGDAVACRALATMMPASSERPV